MSASRFGLPSVAGRRLFGVRLLDVLVALLCLVVALLVLGRQMDREPPMGDEALYIGNARFAEALAHPGSEVWEDGIWVHDQPMLMHYILGGWLLLRGYRPSEFPESYRNYDFDATLAANVAAGRFPDAALLREARYAMVGLGAVAIVLLYVLGRVLGGMTAGLVAAALALARPLVRQELVLVHSEAPLIDLMLLALLLTILAVRRSRGDALPWGWAVAIGVVTGLAIGVKLTALLSLAAAGVWAALVIARAVLRPDRTDRVSEPLAARVIRGSRIAERWLLVAVIAIGIFILSNPHLYRNPLRHIGHMLSYETEAMQQQQLQFPQDVERSLGGRLRFVLGGTLIGVEQMRGQTNGVQQMAPRFVLAGLMIFGAVLLAVRGARDARRTGRAPAEWLVLLTILVYVGGISWNLGLAWPRYLHPIVYGFTLCAGIGVATILRQARPVIPALLKAGPLGWANRRGLGREQVRDRPRVRTGMEPLE